MTAPTAPLTLAEKLDLEGEAGSAAAEWVPLERLHPWDSNPRKNEHAVPKVAESIRTLGFGAPLVARRSDGRVIAGHTRLAAARLLGLARVPVRYVELDDAKCSALALADNRLGEEAEWDRDRLAVLLRGMDEPSRLLVGFTRLEIARLVPPVLPGDPNAVPPPPEIPVARTGDVWLLGESRIVCGDCCDPAVVASVLQKDAPRLLLTDPPYGVSLDMEWRDKALALGGRAGAHATTTLQGDTRADWSQAFEHVRTLDTAYVWHASLFAVEVAHGLRRIGFEVKQQIVWVKPRFALSRQHYHWQHEPCWYARKPGARAFHGPRDQSTVWQAASPKATGGDDEAVDHPTQKPLLLYERPINNHLQPGECFYEPFSGSGTALIAAEQTARRCIAVEIDPRFVDVAVQRWQKFTGRAAVLQATGETFEAVSASKRPTAGGAP